MSTMLAPVVAPKKIPHVGVWHFLGPMLGFRCCAAATRACQQAQDQQAGGQPAHMVSPAHSDLLCLLRCRVMPVARIMPKPATMIHQSRKAPGSPLPALRPLTVTAVGDV